MTTAHPTMAQRLVPLAKGLAVLAAIAAAFWLGFRLGPASPGSGGPSATTPTAGVEYWTCSMHPQIRQAGPGQCPICGMDLIPVRAGDRELPTEKVKYACSMMCIPPVDHPGACPVCGMEMMPVEEAGDVEADELPAHALNEVSLSPRAQRLAKLQTAPVERKFVSIDVGMVGKIEYDETRLRAISSRVPGRLDRLYVDYTGIPVRQGDHLVQIYSPELLAAQEELIQALRSSELDAGRAEDVQRIRRESLEAARQKLTLWGLTADQLVEIEQRGTPSSHLTIYAPIGGIVIEKPLTEGAYVEEGTEIYKIADLTSVWVKLDAYELDLAWIHYGQEVEFASEAYPGETFRGMIAFIDPILNERTRTTKVRVNVPNSDGRLKPGMFVRAAVRSRLTAEGKVMDPALAGKWMCPMHPEVVADGPDSCPKCGMPLVPAESMGYEAQPASEAQAPLVIPATAPLITGPRAVVYVALTDQPGRYQGREVVLGPRADEYYLVREGLAEGEQVVTHGNLYLDSAAQILAKRSMMSPRQEPAPPGHQHAEHPPAPLGAEPRSREVKKGEPAIELPEAGRAALDRLYGDYLEIQNALSHDQFDEARTAAAALATAVRGVGSAELPEAAKTEVDTIQTALTRSIGGITSAGEMSAARAAFEGVSNAVAELARRLGPGSRARLFVYHCPMAFDNRGAAWVQEREGVENPYFGSAMFKCGVLKETISRSNDNAREGRP